MSDAAIISTATARHLKQPFPTSISLPDNIATCALEHFHKRLDGNKGKPKVGEEWTVYAAIVATRQSKDGDKLWVVSCATGTKCTAQRENGYILHDAHAEVLARRGLVRVLWKEIQRNQSSTATVLNDDDVQQDFPSLLVPSAAHEDPHATSEIQCPAVPKYRLDPRIQLHLYISDSPCGDASIYSIASAVTESPNESSLRSNELQYTGAKVVVSIETGVSLSDCGGKHQLLHTASKISQHNVNTTSGSPVTAPTTVVAREESQVLGKLRTKAGRSNLPDHLRSTSMSCSDKIALWGVLGLQGGFLSCLLNPPVIPLTSVVVSRDLQATKSSEGKKSHQGVALERAISSRILQAQKMLRTQNRENTLVFACRHVPTVHVVSAVFSSGKAAMRDVDSCRGNSSPIMPSSGQKRKRESGRCRPDDSSRTKSSPCGIALDWNQTDHDVELLVGARGIRQGKKPKSTQDFQKLSSRLSRANMEKFAAQLLPKPMFEVNGHRSYHHIKTQLAKDYSNCKSILFEEKCSPFSGWVRGVEENLIVHRTN
ncbi:adenosine deaminase/editase [Nitzschia inconspicua]|uniref:tRNA-specific adenosine deaminase 1 n=1 Tax=Nitzschia inconspicua TaxID=303405 RepID=A0A9K3PH62_9STRA|nr:adenosine-deaminase (editase) domain containing protein [Nitzschia inconspicua]KAG7364137.1 adenosine deaminase/editase [Nitzschia inconspicua]